MLSGLANRNLSLPNVGESLEVARKYRANKSQAYKEGFEEFVSNAVPVTLEGRKYLAHPNINLYVDMSRACNADCLFCIAKVKFERAGKPARPEWLERALSLLAPCDPSVQITGGEPTLFRDALAGMLGVVARVKPRRPVLNTNGLRLSGCVDLLEKSCLEHVNVSRHHYNDRDNDRILRASESDSDTLAAALVSIRSRVRVQCNMIGGEIDTYGEVMQFVAYCYHKLGIRNIAFAVLTPLPGDSYYDPGIISEAREKPVDADSILERVEADSRFVFEKYRGGVACYYEVWRFVAYEEPVTVLFKYSDNYWLERADADPQLLPDLVLHTDGTLAGSWCKDRKVIARL